MVDLMQPVSRVLTEHRAQILQKMEGKPGEWTVAALQDQQAMDTVIGCCYELLPGVVRLAVKQPVFHAFMMNNRDRVLAQLVQSTT